MARTIVATDSPSMFAAPMRLTPGSMQDAITTLATLRKSAWDEDRTIGSLRFSGAGGLAVNRVVGDEPTRITGSAARQIAAWHGIPWDYMTRLDEAGMPDLAAHNLNVWAAKAPDQPVLVRGLANRARAFLTDSYRVIWNLDALEVAMDELTKFATARTGSRPEITFQNGEISDTLTTLRVRVPSIAGSIRVGDIVEAGIEFKGSETGHGSLWISGYGFRLSCLNGAKYKVAQEARIVHLGNSGDDRYIFDRVRAGVRAAVLGFNDVLSQMQGAQAQPITRPIDALKNVARSYKFNDAQVERMLMAFGAEQEATAFGVVNAVTRAAQGAPTFDERAEMEAAGGDLLAVRPADFVRQFDREYKDARN